MKWILIVLAASLGLGLSVPGETQANIQEAFGLSPKSISMANAVSAIADDFAASYYNPAGLGQQNNHQMFLGYSVCHPLLKQYSAEDPDNVNIREDIAFRSVVIGTIFDLSQAINTRGHNFTLGMALVVGDNFKGAWRIHDWNPEEPRFIHYGDYLNRLHTYISMGLEVIKDKVYIGGGINFWTDFGAKVELTVDPLQVDPITKELDVNGDTEISPIAGILIKPFSWLSLAYTYRDGWVQKTSNTFAVNLALAGINLVPPLTPLSLEFTLSDYYLPMNMTGGVALTLFDSSLVLAVDVTYYQWSDFYLPMWENHPDWRGKLIKWDDTVIPRFGLDYELWEKLHLRAGYYYEQSPIPDQSDVRSNHLDFDKHVICSGFGYSLEQLPFVGKLPLAYPVALDAFFQYQLMNERTQKKDASTGQNSWKIKGSQYAFGAGITLVF